MGWSRLCLFLIREQAPSEGMNEILSFRKKRSRGSPGAPEKGRDETVGGVGGSVRDHSTSETTIFPERGGGKSVVAESIVVQIDF